MVKLAGGHMYIYIYIYAGGVGGGHALFVTGSRPEVSVEVGF